MLKFLNQRDQENNHKKRIEEESLQECTHHPKVNNISKMIMVNRSIKFYLSKK